MAKIPLVKKEMVAITEGKVPLVMKDKAAVMEKKTPFQWPTKIVGTYGSEYAEIDKYILDTLNNRVFKSSDPIKCYCAYGDIEESAQDYAILAHDVGEAFIKVAKLNNELFIPLLVDYFTALDQSFDQWEKEDYTYRPTLDQLIKAVEDAPSLDMDTYLKEKITI